MKNGSMVVVAMMAGALLCACSEQQVYQSGQGLRQSECQKILDAAKRISCLDEADKTYRDYERARAADSAK